MGLVGAHCVGSYVLYVESSFITSLPYLTILAYCSCGLF
jgi:hypothetical protein